MNKIKYNIKYEQFDIEGKQYHLAVYELQKTDSPKETIVMLHGVDGVANDFDYLSQELVKHDYKVILIDMFGRGKSSNMDNKELYNNDFYVKILLETFQRLSLSKITLLGTSMGGLLSIMIGSQTKNMIEKIIINDIGPYIDPKKQLKLARFFNTIKSFHKYEASYKFLIETYQWTGIKSKQQWQHFCRHRIIYKNGQYHLNFDTKIFQTFLKYAETMQPIDIWNDWNNISDNTKIMILRGSLSTIFTKDILNKMLLKDNTYSYTFVKIGHAPMLFSQEQINTVVDWLDKN